MFPECLNDTDITWECSLASTSPAPTFDRPIHYAHPPHGGAEALSGHGIPCVKETNCRAVLCDAQISQKCRSEL